MSKWPVAKFPIWFLLGWFISAYSVSAVTHDIERMNSFWTVFLAWIALKCIAKIEDAFR